MAYLEEGILDPEDKVYNRGFFRNERLYPNYTLDDTAPPGDYDFVKAFKRSSNTYFIHYALTPDGRTDQWQQGKRIPLDWGNRFRLGKRTMEDWSILGEKIPSPVREGGGYYPPRGNEFKKIDQYGKRSRWSAGDVANLCIGQGEITVTPLQMAVMTSAVANGGKLMQPRLVLRMNSPHALGQAQNRIIPEKVVADLNLKPETVSLLHEAMLADVDDRDGSGRAARCGGCQSGVKPAQRKKRCRQESFILGQGCVCTGRITSRVCLVCPGGGAEICRRSHGGERRVWRDHVRPDRRADLSGHSGNRAA